MPNWQILDEAQQVAAEAVTEFCSGQHQAVVCQAVAGAGKSQLVVEAAGLRPRGLPTRQLSPVSCHRTGLGAFWL